MDALAKRLLRAAARKADELSRAYADEAHSQTTVIMHASGSVVATTPEGEIARRKSVEYASLRDRLHADEEDLTWLGGRE